MNETRYTGKRLDVVELAWADHSGPWKNVDDAELVERTSVGYLVRETDEAIFIAGTNDHPAVEDVTVIGKGMIRTMRFLVRKKRVEELT